MDDDTNDVHVTKTAGKNRESSRSRKDEHDDGADKWCTKVNNAIGKPCEDIQERICVFRQDVAKVGTVNDVLKSRQHANPNRRTPFGGDKPSKTNDVSGRQLQHG